MEWFKFTIFKNLILLFKKPKKMIVGGEDKKKNDSVIRTPR